MADGAGGLPGKVPVSHDLGTHGLKQPVCPGMRGYPGKWGEVVMGLRVLIQQQ